MCTKMKKLVFFFAVAAGFALVACGGQKTDANSADADSLNTDTIVMDYGTVEVDSISPDSVEVTVVDTTLEMVAEPDAKK